MQNSIVVFILFVQTGNTFFGQSWSKNEKCELKLKFGTYTNSNMQNSIVVFTFFCFRLETRFLGKFGPKKLVSRLIPICRIQWWCLLFLFQMGNFLFMLIRFKKSIFTISKIYAFVKITRQLKYLQRVELWELAPDIRQSNS